MSTTADRLYELLPAIYRIRDAEVGQPLRALCAILEQEVDAVRDDIDGLYENWFVETCDEWAVHYIGDLLRVPPLHSGAIGTFSLRSYAANVLAYRRRKGTPSVLEQMSHDVSGWPARAVEFYKRLATTQHLNHVRLDSPAIASLRDANRLELLGGPFEAATHAADVRNIGLGRGRYNIPNIGLFLWRLQSYAVQQGQPGPPGSDAPAGCFTFDPLGRDLPLFNRPQTETDISHLAEEFNVPDRLRRRPLFDELNALRASLLAGQTPTPVYFGTDPALRVYQDGAPIPPEAMMICDLSDWHTPAADGAIRAQVDPVLGRLALAGAPDARDLAVDYAYGFSSDIGGGPYDRSASLVGLFEYESAPWFAGVSQAVTVDGGGTYTSLAAAVAAWNTRTDDTTVGVIAIQDSRSYTEDLSGDARTVVIPAGHQLLIVAGRWRSDAVPQAGDWSGDLNLLLTADGLRPHIRGDLHVAGKTATEAGQPGRLLLNGLLVEGALTVPAGCPGAGASDLGGVSITHCSLVPNESWGLRVAGHAGANAQLVVDIDHSICGPLRVPGLARPMRIADSIIDAGVLPGEPACHGIAGDPESSGSGVEPDYAPALTIERSTVFDAVRVREMTLASETVFMAPVDTERLQAGCVRFSYVTPGSRLPRRFRCQPDLALIQRARDLTGRTDVGAGDLPETEIARVQLSVRPSFTSATYGDPAYAQLGRACAVEISAGGEDGSEMGAFNHLRQPQRETNIRVNLSEYLRFGMAAGIFYVN